MKKKSPGSNERRPSFETVVLKKLKRYQELSTEASFLDINKKDRETSEKIIPEIRRLEEYFSGKISPLREKVIDEVINDYLVSIGKVDETQHEKIKNACSSWRILYELSIGEDLVKEITLDSIRISIQALLKKGNDYIFRFSVNKV